MGEFDQRQKSYRETKVESLSPDSKKLTKNPDSLVNESLDCATQAVKYLLSEKPTKFSIVNRIISNHGYHESFMDVVNQFYIEILYEKNPVEKLIDSNKKLIIPIDTQNSQIKLSAKNIILELLNASNIDLKKFETFKSLMDTDLNEIEGLDKKLNELIREKIEKLDFNSLEKVANHFKIDQNKIKFFAKDIILIFISRKKYKEALLIKDYFSFKEDDFFDDLSQKNFREAIKEKGVCFPFSDFRIISLSSHKTPFSAKEILGALLELSKAEQESFINTIEKRVLSLKDRDDYFAQYKTQLEFLSKQNKEKIFSLLNNFENDLQRISNLKVILKLSRENLNKDLNHVLRSFCSGNFDLNDLRTSVIELIKSEQNTFNKNALKILLKVIIEDSKTDNLLNLIEEMETPPQYVSKLAIVLKKVEKASRENKNIPPSKLSQYIEDFNEVRDLIEDWCKKFRDKSFAKFVLEKIEERLYKNFSQLSSTKDLLLRNPYLPSFLRYELDNITIDAYNADSFRKKESVKKELRKWRSRALECLAQKGISDFDGIRINCQNVLYYLRDFSELGSN